MFNFISNFFKKPVVEKPEIKNETIADVVNRFEKAIKHNNQIVVQYYGSGQDYIIDTDVNHIVGVSIRLDGTYIMLYHKPRIRFAEPNKDHFICHGAIKIEDISIYNYVNELIKIIK